MPIANSIRDALASRHTSTAPDVGQFAIAVDEDDIIQFEMFSYEYRGVWTEPAWLPSDTSNLAANAHLTLTGNDIASWITRSQENDAYANSLVGSPCNESFANNNKTLSQMKADMFLRCVQVRSIYDILQEALDCWFQGICCLISTDGTVNLSKITHTFLADVELMFRKSLTPTSTVQPAVFSEYLGCGEMALSDGQGGLLDGSGDASIFRRRLQESYLDACNHRTHLSNSGRIVGGHVTILRISAAL